jgi:hypothetical protein
MVTNSLAGTDTLGSAIKAADTCVLTYTNSSTVVSLVTRIERIAFVIVSDAFSIIDRRPTIIWIPAGAGRRIDNLVPRVGLFVRCTAIDITVPTAIDTTIPTVSARTIHGPSVFATFRILRNALSIAAFLAIRTRARSVVTVPVRGAVDDPQDKKERCQNGQSDGPIPSHHHPPPESRISKS